MSLIKITGLKTDFNNATNPSSTLHLDVFGSTGLKIKHTSEGVSGYEINTKNFRLDYNRKTQDLEFSRKFNILKNRVSLFLKQSVPQNKFFLIPTPLVRLSVVPLLTTNFKVEVSKQHDFMKGTGLFDGVATYTFGKHVFEAKTDSEKKLEGALLKLSSKEPLGPGLPLASAVTTFSRKDGLNLLLRSSPLCDGCVTLESVLLPRTNAMNIKAILKPALPKPYSANLVFESVLRPDAKPKSTVKAGFALGF